MTKKITSMFVVLLFATTFINAQAPQSFNYQAVVRDASGNLITSGNVTLDFIIRQGSTAGTTVYSETQVKTPNPYGLVTALIGIVTPATFSTIAWGTNSFFIETKVNGTSVSNTQLQSVPYALSAANGNWTKSGNNIYNSNSGKVGIGTTTPDAKLTIGTPGVTWTDYGITSDSRIGITEGAAGRKALILANYSGRPTIEGYDYTNNTYLNLALNQNGGNVGVGTGTLTPNDKLDVYGPLRIGGNVPGNGFSFTQLSGDLVIAYKVGQSIFTNNIMSLGYQGKIGMGTATPTSPLTVAGASPFTTASLQRTYFNSGTSSALVSDVNASGNVQIEARGYVWANGGGYVATSDKRIKNIIGLTNNQKDLADLNKIEITDYKPIDELTGGNRIQKKVIAQQVNSIFPTAVMTSKGMIPNVYEVAAKVTVKGEETLIETKKAHTFKNGDNVKLILEKGGEKEVCVTVVNEHQFTVDEVINDKVFVYGKTVNDLMMVDYDALTTLNISATQELYKRIVALETENAGLKTENNAMKAELQNANAATASLKADVDAIKTQLGIGSQVTVK